MMSISQLLGCISKQVDGQYIAQYEELTLRSVFQPIYKKDLSIIGLEALVRISTADGSMIRPDLFFQSPSISEHVQLNVERLSRLIHIKNFGQSRYRNKKLFLNVLPRAAEMLAKDLSYSHLLKQVICEADLRREQIVMELVELRAGDESFLYKATKELSDGGFKLAIDDYGINASTIERVKCVRPDIIKMDRSLLLKYEDGDFSALIEALALAKELSSKTVIEGIETEHQLNLMKKLGFDMYQGYLLAMPQTLEMYEEAKTA
ncbi:EAL domain-containing protein [Vibrio parahaemolyticus]|uniref:EAL domain-containing protein n=1 Tax=Vibrio parahaemolyticus TaxID=670 RepID=UPI0003F7649E|nr:EAL domain-containing protein [Vibrio parahaemolyticus]HCH6231975.1 EAL domain-containing protein [Vibrio parahaemolyticus]HCM1461102.1 EAL domain-containing protein [Vibrio parahaemolyticus]